MVKIAGMTSVLYSGVNYTLSFRARCQAVDSQFPIVLKIYVMTKQENMNRRYIPNCALERKRSVILKLLLR